MSTLQSEDCQNNDPNDLLPTSFESLRRFPIDHSVLFTGFFNGFNVELRGCEDVALYTMGCFGKGTASRSRPMAQKEYLTMRKRQFLKRNEWYKKFCGPAVMSKPDLFLRAVEKLNAKILNDGEKRKNKDLVDLVSSDGSYSSDDDMKERDYVKITSNITDLDNIAVVVPDSDSDCQDYFDNLRAECCINQTKLPEKLILTLQEAFFLVYGLGSLQIIDLENHILNIQQCWELFKETDRKFVPKYIVYHYFRAKGYVVKPGIKFGGDYLLYKGTPETNHSEFIVVVKCEQDEADWITILGHVRMANTTVKKILIAEVVNPKIPGITPEGLKNYSVRETVIIRNIGQINEDE